MATNNDCLFFIYSFLCDDIHSLFVCPFKGAIMLFFSQSLNWSFCSIELPPYLEGRIKQTNVTCDLNPSQVEQLLN